MTCVMNGQEQYIFSHSPKEVIMKQVNIRGSTNNCGLVIILADNVNVINANNAETTTLIFTCGSHGRNF